MNEETKAYFTGIEKKLIEMIGDSNKSIKIAMAWFTSNDLKNCILDKKRQSSKVEIEIVVDDNEINENYFLDYKPKFDELGIIIKQKVSSKFLHNKFMLIDEKIVITGSYNFSKKAKSNLENIVVIKSESLCYYYSRIFEFITTSNYLDENIQLLLDYPDFAQAIISTYYEFTKSEYLKYKKKILIGGCFTHENGYWDELTYFPGFIFNPKINYLKNFESPEFSLPIDKKIIKLWTKRRNEDLILDNYAGKEEYYHLIDGDLEQNENAVEEFFKRKMEHTYQSKKLKELIESKIDIILEDDLWRNNFDPFINRKIIEKIFANIKVLKQGQ